jgi:hypothetical protein
MMVNKILFLALFLVLVGVFGVVLYVMSQMNIEHLISCSSKESGTKLPASLCEYYMVNYRITKSDIDELSNGAGLDYILNGENSIKYEIAEIFMSKGLNVDGINNFNDKDLTPLQAAVLHNDVQRVMFLVKHGADKSIKSKSYGMTALELARKLHKEESKEDRSEIINILSTASNT